MKNLLITIFTLLILTSCNFESAEDDASGGGLFSNNEGVENKFYLLPLLSTTYLESQFIDITIQHPSAVSVTGVPSIEIEMDSSIVSAHYIAGSGSSKLTFRYTIQAGDTDTDGIEIDSAINLNTGSLTFFDQGVSTAANLDIIKLVPSNIFVDTSAPSVSIVSPPPVKTYLKGEKIQFIVFYDSIVSTTGQPRLALDIGGVTAYAEFLSGIDGFSSIYSYTVQENDLDSDGITVSSAIELNEGMIQDESGNNALLAFIPPPMPTTFVDGETPHVVNIIAPSSGTYQVDEALNLTLQFSENVVITGTPQLTVTLDSSPQPFTYISGSGTDEIIFQYIVQEGDSALSGITLDSVIDLNTGLIQDNSANNTELNLDVPLIPDVIIDAGIARVTNITVPSDDTYNIGDELFFTLVFDKEITVTGEPKLDIQLASHPSGTILANYISGSDSNELIFRYQVQSGELDLDGIQIGDLINLDNGTIIAANTIAAQLNIASPILAIDTSSILIDAAKASVISVTPPSDNNYLTGSFLDFTVHFSKPVLISNSPRLIFDIGGVTHYANYLSGSNSTSIIFRYTPGAPDSDIDGISMSNSIDLNSIGEIKDSSAVDALIDMSLHIPDLSEIFINKSTASILSITPPADTTYTGADSLDFIVNTNEIINTSGSPQIAVNIGSTTKYAQYISGSGTTALTFRYTIEAGLEDTDGISISSPIELNSGTLQNVMNQDLALNFTEPAMTNVLVDSLAPSITSVIAPANATYSDTDLIEFTFTTDTPIDVVGTPRLSIDIGGITKYAQYSSGSGTSSLVFSYTVESGLSDLDGISALTSLELNSATLKDSAMRDLDLNFTALDLSSVLIDSVVPLITSITPPIDQTYSEGDNMDFVINTDEDIDVTGVPRLELDIGGTIKFAQYLSGTGSSALIFRYTVEAALSDTDGVNISASLELNTASMQSGSSENLDPNLTPPNLTGVLVDSSAPSVEILNPLDLSFINTNNDSSNFEITGTCSEAGKTVLIEIDSLPALSPINFLCDGTNFTGTIDTTSLSQTPHTLQAKINDDALNEGNSIVFNITKDISTPSITAVSAPPNGLYKESQTMEFTVSTSENITVSGTPRLVLTIDGVSRYADYFSGSASGTLIFRYTVSSGQEDLNGIEFFSSSIDLNLGSLEDTAGNSINLDLESSSSLPDVTNINIDSIVPLVSVDSFQDITAANESTYSVSGNCSENGLFVSLSIGSINLSVPCNNGSWSSGSTDVSSIADSPSVAITADHSDAATNSAIQSLRSVSKDTASTLVTINSPQDISQANLTSYLVSGSCTDIGSVVDVYIGSLNFQPNCSGGTWSTGYVDVSVIPDGASVSITANHNTAPQASINVSKDTLSATVTITSAPSVTISNQANYFISGSCSENTNIVDLYIGSLNFQPTCLSNSWSVTSADISSLADGSVLITADHSSATQNSITINKNTGTPTVADLSIPSTLRDSSDLHWNLNDPGGFSIDDFEINYRVKNDSTWLTFNDGVSTSTSSTVTSLLPSTVYEFRVRLKYDSTQFSQWSNIAQGETKPDNSLFNSAYTAMNVGGSTNSNVVALQDNTRIFLNGVEIPASPIAKGIPVALPTHARYDVIDADGPIFTGGRIGSGGNTSKGNIAWQPTSWAGKSFSFNATRESLQQLHVYATENTTVQVKQGSTVLDSATITAGNGVSLSWTTHGSYQVTSTGTILAFHISGAGAGIVDPKPLLPSSKEIIGFPSNSMRLTTIFDSTNYSLIHSNSVINSGSLSMVDSITVSPQGGSTSQYQGDSLLLSADRPISGASYADSNGNCAAPYLPTNLMKKKYVINTSSDWVAFASKGPGTISVYSPSQTIGVDTPAQTLTLTRSGANSNAPYKVRVGSTPAGYRFISSVSIAGWYQPDNDSGSADQDETILYGSD